MKTTVYRSVYLGNDEAASGLKQDLHDLPRAIDISVSRVTREFFRNLVAAHREEINTFQAARKRRKEGLRKV